MPGSKFHAGWFRLLAIAGCLCLFGSLWASTATRRPEITGIRYWSTTMYTRVAIDLQGEVRYKATRVSSPDRIFFDLYDTRLSSRLVGKINRVTDEGFLRQVHAVQLPGDITRVILNVSDVSQYYAFFLPNPARLIIDVRGGGSGSTRVKVARAIPAISPRRHPGIIRSTPRRKIVRSASVAGIGLGPNVIAANRMGEPLPISNHRTERVSRANALAGESKPSP